MKIILPTIEQVGQINASRTLLGDRMAAAGTLTGPLSVYGGPCATDSNRHANGELATVRHNTAMAAAADELPDAEYSARANGSKPRTRDGTTGLLHQPGGLEVYGECAQTLTNRGVRLVAEVMDESDAAVAEPWLSAKWGGARNVEDTGTRHLLRTPEDELEKGIVPAPAWVKNSRHGGLEPAVHALHTIRAEKPERRLRFTLEGLKEVVTHPNLRTGLLLRGHTPRPEGSLDDILEEEIVTARRTLDAEFGVGVIALGLDISHDHAKWEGGGEEGQLAIAKSLARLMSRGVILDLVMMESYLLPGNQPEGGKVPGLSQVDKCVREAKAILVLQELNDARARQQLVAASKV